jgi:SNF2 family DNA or RNA helicase
MAEKKVSIRELKERFVPNPNCGLVTWYTQYKGIADKDLEKLERIRKHDPESGPIPIKMGSKYGQIPPRNYQTMMIAHMAILPRLIIGDAVGLGKTICAIASSCYHYDRVENLKVIVLTTRSTVYQWASEFEKFSDLNVWVMKDKYRDLKSNEARLKQVEHFLNGKKKDVLIAKYTSLIGKRKRIEGEFDDNGDPAPDDKKEVISQEILKLCELMAPHGEHIYLILDEGQKFKSAGTSIRTLVENIQKHAHRVHVMTATGLKNKLDEFYSIAWAVGIRPFGTEFSFKYNFCVQKKKHIGRGRYKWDIVGYKNVRDFKMAIRPFYYGRSQAQVKEKLPKLATIFHPFDLSDKEYKLLLKDIPNGDYVLPPSIKKVAGEVVEVKDRSIDNMMTAMSVFQLVANSSALLDRDDPKIFHNKALSSKEEELLDLLDGELSGQKVIVFTKYRSWIDRLEWLSKEGHFTDRNFLRITGAENEKKREINRRLFQESDEHDLIFINAAGIEGINLQQAAHMIVLDCPWSWGDMLQLVGRMLRMASPHSACTLHILMAKGTIDEYVIETLRSKKGVFEVILGETYSAGVLDDGTELLDMTSGMDKIDDENDFEDMLKAHVKTLKLKNFIDGTNLTMNKIGVRKTILETKKPKKRVEEKELWNTDSYSALQQKVSSLGGGVLDDDE